MANIQRAASTVPAAAADSTHIGLLVAVCVAVAIWAIWTMLGAVFDSDWLQGACMLMVWTAAVGTTYLLVPPSAD
jgi:hypothetical protein